MGILKMIRRSDKSKEIKRLKAENKTIKKDLLKAIKKAKAGKEFNIPRQTLELANIPRIYRYVEKMRKPASSWLINMQMRTGDYETFLVTTNKDHFRHLGGLYTIDETCRYYNATAKMACLDYHQDLPLPVKREIDADAIKTAIESSNVLMIDNALNPHALDRWEESSIIMKLLDAAGITDMLKKVMLIAAVGAIASVILLLIWLQQSGFFSNLPIIGGG